MMRVVVLMLPLLVLTVCFCLVLQVDADAHAVSADVLGDGGVYYAVGDVVADGDEADGDIRISGIKTT